MGATRINTCVLTLSCAGDARALSWKPQPARMLDTRGSAHTKNIFDKIKYTSIIIIST